MTLHSFELLSDQDEEVKCYVRTKERDVKNASFSSCFQKVGCVATILIIYITCIHQISHHNDSVDEED